jgi:flagellar protein FliS
MELIPMAFPPNAAKLAAYRSTSVHTGVESSDPHRLIVMMMDGALERIATARGLMSHGQGADKAQLLHRAVAIIDELRNSLNFKAGGQIAGNLDALYEYMCQRIMQANAAHKPEWLDEVSRLLGEIRSAWLQLSAQGRAQVSGAP